MFNQTQVGLWAMVSQRKSAADPVPVTPITQIAASGWAATYPSPPEIDPVGAPETISVTRQGFNSAGAAISLVENLRVMKRIRRPWPDQETLTTDQVVLSDFVYQQDSVPGVVNTSTRPYPKPIAVWLNHDRERATSGTHTLRLAVAHAYGRNGRPVAAVRFSLSDGVSTVEQTVSAMSSISYSASGLSVPHFAAEMDLSGLAQGALLVVDAVIYPWVGEAFTVSLEGDSYPSPNLTTLRLLNDRTGAFGTAYAYVDAVSGSDGSGVVSATATAAQASAFATIPAAAAAIKSFNTATFSRNTTSGGIIRLAPGTHTGGFFSASATGEIPLVIEAADPAQKAATILQNAAFNTQISIPKRLKIRGITLGKTGGSVVFLDNGTFDASGQLVVEDCIWTLDGGSEYGAWIYRIGIFWLINCTGNAGQIRPFGTVYKASISIGCDLNTSGHGCYNMLASRASSFLVASGLGQMPVGTGSFAGWNSLSQGLATNEMMGSAQSIGARGLALVGNMLESWGAHYNHLFKINADGDTSPVQNVVVMGNTAVGGRSNVLYADVPTSVEKTGYFRFNVLEELNIKSDLFASQSGNVGNWAARFRAGWGYNALLSGGSDGRDYGPEGWMGELPGLGEVVAVDPDWVSDQSNQGGDVGGGSYVPGPNSALPRIPPGGAAFPNDLFGRPIPDDGTAFIGAAQRL